MLPLIDWLTDNWDPLLHEERLPFSSAGLSAAESLSQTRLPPLSLREGDELAWMDARAAWWGRHSVRAGREGGLFPDLYLRRYRDTLEVSTGSEPIQGVPEECVFLMPNGVYYLDPVQERLATLGGRITQLAVPSRERETTRTARLGAPRLSTM